MGWAFVGNVVIHATGETWDDATDRMGGSHPELGAFYAEVLGARVLREDWVKVGRDPLTYPQIAIDGVRGGSLGSSEESGYEPPRWADPDRGPQLCMEIAVGDVHAVRDKALKLGATTLEERDGRVALADPHGHPLWLVAGPDHGAQALEIALDVETRTIEPTAVDPAAARIARVVVDCFSPRALAPFYEGLLDLRRVADEAELVVVSREDGAGVELAFRHVPTYVPPAWGDDRRHQQVHLDLWFEDPAEARARAMELGGIRLPHPRGNVYADPAGHPLCLLALGE